MSIHRGSLLGAWMPGPAQAMSKQKMARQENLQRTPAHPQRGRQEQAAGAILPSIRGHTIARNRKEKTAPSARPRDRKKAMMAPAVSASAGFTFLKEGGRADFRTSLTPVPCPTQSISFCWPTCLPLLLGEGMCTEAVSTFLWEPLLPSHYLGPRGSVGSSLSLEILSSAIRSLLPPTLPLLRVPSWSTRPCLRPPYSPLTWAQSTCRDWQGSHWRRRRQP